MFRKSTRIAGLIIFITFSAIQVEQLMAQTCSCAGAPLIGSQSAGVSEQGNLLFGLTYEFNQITRLYSGSDRLTNDTTERNTQSVLFEVHFGITDRLSASGTFSFVNKERLSGLSSPSGTQRSNTSGVGDGLVMLRYVILQQSLWKRYHLAAGAGVKAPIGTTSLRNSSGLRFNADMQPGTGAWDGIFWSQTSVNLIPRSTMNITLMNSFRVTGENQRFTSNDNYRFGNELVSTLMASDGITTRLGYSLGLRYRSSSSDRLNGITQRNTGGKWVSIIPELHAGISERISLIVSGQVPVYQNLNGTQPTTTYTASATLFLNFNSSKDSFIHGRPN